MKAEDVPADLFALAANAPPPPLAEQLNGEVWVRWILAAVLPEHEKQVREQVAQEIEKVADEDADGSSWDVGMGHAAEIARGGAR